MRCKQILFFLCITWSATLHAQKDSLSYEDQYAYLETLDSYYSDPQKQIDETDKVLASGEVTRTSYIAALYSMRAKAMERLYEDLINEFNYDTSNADARSVIYSILEWHNKAVNACEDCATSNRLVRYEFEEQVNILKSEAKEDEELLKKMGYKPEADAASLGFSYTRSDKSTLIGLEFSAYSLYVPRYKLAHFDSETHQREYDDENIVPIYLQIALAGYNQNISRPGYEVWASPIRMTAPVVVDLAKFGFTENYRSGQTVAWFWRPELGAAWGPLSVSCGYNYVFKKTYREESNTWFITARLSYPVFTFLKKK